MSTTSNLAVFGLAAIYLVAAVAFIGYICKKLAVRHGSDIRVVWYLLSLASTVTFLIAMWARSKGALDENGNPHGAAGDAVYIILTFMLDFEGDMKLFGTLVALVVIPQCASWVLSGLSGCATAPILVVPAFRFFFWSVLKSMVVVSGILFSVASYAWLQGWDGMHAREFFRFSGVALLSIMVSFVVLLFYRDLHVSMAPSGKPTKLGRLLRRINAWANRNMPSKSNCVGCDSEA
jgi:hypothetical protein